MADTDICPHCDVLLEWHDHEHIARHCLPKQLKAARARIAELEEYKRSYQEATLQNANDVGEQMTALAHRLAEVERERDAVRAVVSCDPDIMEALPDAPLADVVKAISDSRLDLRRQLDEAHAVLRDNANYMAIHGMLSQAWTDCLAATRRVEDKNG